MDTLVEQNLLTYSLHEKNKIIQYKIKDWPKDNTALSYNYPCKKDIGFFFFPIADVHKLIGLGKCSEMDALLDLWIHAVYNDPSVQGSDAGPVVYFRNQTGNPLFSYQELARRWKQSKSSVSRLLKKLEDTDMITLISYSGKHGSMQNRYPYNQWQEIIGNCDTQLFLGCTDEVTATFISNRSGDVTVGVSSEAKQLNSWRVSDYTPEYRQTKSIGKRKLLTPDEILRLPLDTALVILRGQKVLKVEKYDYTLHPDAKKLTPRKASEHIPEWRKNGSSEETEYRPQPSPGSAKRKRRSSSASIAKQKPHFTSEPVYQEPTPDDFMEDFFQENFIEDSPDSGMVPLDKDSIMS